MVGDIGMNILSFFFFFDRNEYLRLMMHTIRIFSLNTKSLWDSIHGIEGDFFLPVSIWSWLESYREVVDDNRIYKDKIHI